MRRGTGCVSIAAIRGADVAVERIIEYVQPERHAYTIWVDVFINNFSNQEQDLLILHRGSFSAVDETQSLLHPIDDSSGEIGNWLTRRSVRLHKNFAQINIIPNQSMITVGCRAYPVFSGSRLLGSPKVGGDPAKHAPFTMWEVGGFPANQREVFRLKLTMSQETFKEHIGQEGVVYSYGEPILLDKIEYDDLPSLPSDDPLSDAGFKGRKHEADVYRRAFARFKTSHHLPPDVLEYVVVGPEGQDLTWEITPQSPGFSPQVITCESLQKNTRWFIFDYSPSGKPSSVGKLYAGFVLKMDARELKPIS